MIKIELKNTIKEKNIYLHKQYIRGVMLGRLETYLSGDTKNSTDSLYDQYCTFLKNFLGQREQERARGLLALCIADDLEELVGNFEKTFFDLFKFSFKNPESDTQKIIAKKIKDIFDSVLDYENFNSGRMVEGVEGKRVLWNRHVYVINTGVKVCPYCNRQYITSYNSKEEIEKTTADVDHYYPKSLYPYLQMNIYNMIPSCNVCNSKTKGFKDERHLNPYQDETDSLIFEIPLNDVESMYSLNVKKIIVNTQGNPKSIASNKIFKLEEIYQAHIPDIKRLLHNFKEYEAFKEKYYMKTMGLDIGDVFSLWFDFLDMKPLDEPLAKLKQDIYKQLSSDSDIV